MEALIPIINELQAVFKSTGASEEIDLPQIVVVGSQSCGKSSVLENLVGRSFLPRGSGIVTRSPTILQLTHVTEKDADGNTEWCVVKDDNDEDIVITDYDKVREAIERKTDQCAGTNKGISMDPIIVRVYSPHVVSLTVVDLPGIVKVPVGDQPLDIEAQVQRLIMKYICNENALILAVSPANADIATSESIKIAKAVDPLGDRTLAVVTKLDLMDKGTDATKVLSGEIINVKLGIIGVVNRSQEDINNNKPIEEAWEDETNFLNKHYPSKFGAIGSSYLAKRLNELLQCHIKKTLPALIERIRELTAYYEELQKEMGAEIAVNGKVSPWVMIQAVTDFAADFVKNVEGRHEHDALSTSKNSRVLVGAKINKIFENFCYSLKKEQANYTVEDEMLEGQISNTANVEGFTSVEGVFKNLARQRIAVMERYSTQCADDVHKILAATVKDSLKDKRLQRLNEEIIKVTKKLFLSQLQQTKKSINEYIRIQTTMIFSHDEKFLSLLQTNDSNSNASGTHNEAQYLSATGMRSTGASFPVMNMKGNSSGKQCTYVKGLISSYMDVMRCQISDYIPKHIFYHLYKMTMENIRGDIISAAEGRENVLLQENEGIVRQRREANAMLESLRKAYEIVNGIEAACDL